MADIIGEHRSARATGKVVVYCPVHKEREAELYCETCEQLICYKCAVKGGAHNSHEYKDLSEACEGYMTEMKEGVAVLKKLCGEVSTKQEAIVAKIHEKAEQLHTYIDNAKTQMLSELIKMADEIIATLKAQIQDAETAQVQYSCGIEISSPFTQNPADVLSKRVTIVKQMKQTVDTFRAENMKPDNRADMMFLSPEDGRANLGKVLQCYAARTGINKLRCGQPNVVTLHCRTAKGEPFADNVLLECKLVAEGSDYQVTISITAVTQAPRAGGLQLGGVPVAVSQGGLQLGQANHSGMFGRLASYRGQFQSNLGQFRITCQPSACGWHQLHIIVCGQHIRGSPFRVESV